MATSKESKSLQLDEIKLKLKDCGSFVLVEYIGTNVKQDTALRNQFRAKGVDYKVYKNRLLKIALNEMGFTEFDKHLEKTTAVASAADMIAPASAVMEIVKDVKTFKIKCGYVDGAYIDAAGVDQLSRMPSKPILLGILLGTMQAPITGLAASLNAVIAGLALALNAIIEKSPASAEATE